MPSMIIAKDQVPALLEQWLKRTGDAPTQVEVMLSSEQIVIRELSGEKNALDQWIDDYFQRRDNLMRRLADA